MDYSVKIHIKELKEGDIHAFEQIFNHYYKGLIHFAESYVKNKDDARDVVQSIFLMLWERRTSLLPDTNITGYLFTLTRNACLNYLNHLKARANYLATQELNWNEIQLNSYALERFNSDNLIYEELEKTFQEAIESLPTQSAEVFRLSRFEGLKYAEIATRLNISVKTVEKKMSIALLKLRLALKKYYVVILLFMNC